MIKLILNLWKPTAINSPYMNSKAEFEGLFRRVWTAQIDINLKDSFLSQAKKRKTIQFGRLACKQHYSVVNHWGLRVRSLMVHRHTGLPKTSKEQTLCAET